MIQSPTRRHSNVYASSMQFFMTGARQPIRGTFYAPTGNFRRFARVKSYNDLVLGANVQAVRSPAVRRRRLSANWRKEPCRVELLLAVCR
jgi:hypothetical protein